VEREQWPRIFFPGMKYTE